MSLSSLVRASLTCFQGAALPMILGIMALEGIKEKWKRC
jgi:hypothetical protein